MKIINFFKYLFCNNLSFKHPFNSNITLKDKNALGRIILNTLSSAFKSMSYIVPLLFIIYNNDNTNSSGLTGLIYSFIIIIVSCVFSNYKEIKEHPFSIYEFRGGFTLVSILIIFLTIGSNFIGFQKGASLGFKILIISFEMFINVFSITLFFSIIFSQFIDYKYYKKIINIKYLKCDQLNELHNTLNDNYYDLVNDKYYDINKIYKNTFNKQLLEDLLKNINNIEKDKYYKTNSNSKVSLYKKHLNKKR